MSFSIFYKERALLINVFKTLFEKLKKIFIT